MFNFNTGVFYKTLRTKLGLIYNVEFESDIDIVNSKSSSYNIKTNCEIKNVPVIIFNIINL